MNGEYSEKIGIREIEGGSPETPGAAFGSRKKPETAFGRAEILELLKAKGIEFEYMEHPPLYTMEDIKKYGLPHRELIAKNVFASDDKRRTYFLISIKGDERADLKAIGKPWGYNHLRFASSEELSSMLGLYPGAVSPFGLLNDGSAKIIYCVDRRLLGGLIGAHPNDNTASVWLEASDLLGIIKEHGNPVYEF